MSRQSKQSKSSKEISNRDISLIRRVCNYGETGLLDDLSDKAYDLFYGLLEIIMNYSEIDFYSHYLYKVLECYKEKDYQKMSYKPKKEQIYAYNNLKFIIGPVSLAFITTPSKLTGLLGNKKILIFGDSHRAQTTCKSTKNTLLIPEFIEQYALKSKQTVDLLIENSKHSHSINNKFKKPGDNKSFLNMVKNYFDDCLASQSCKNLRIHYTDIRKDIKRKRMERTESKKKVLEYVKDYSRKNINEYIIKLKIFRQTSKISNKQLRETINEYFQGIINRQFDKNDKLLKDLSDEFVRFKIIGNIHVIRITMMDWYLMGRLFSTFSDGYEMKNIIIYVGSQHALGYIKFFRHLGMNIDNKIKRQDKCDELYRCLDVSGLTF